jgi:hypothetical protein
MSTYTAQSDAITVMQTPLASLSTIDSSDVIYVNNMYAPTQGVKHIQCFMLFSETFQASLGVSGQYRLDGVFQIDVAVPVGGGRSEINSVLAEIRELYKPGTTLTNDNISVRCKSVWEATPYDGEGWYTVPINVRWYAYTDNE